MSEPSDALFRHYDFKVYYHVTYMTSFLVIFSYILTKFSILCGYGLHLVHNAYMTRHVKKCETLSVVAFSDHRSGHILYPVSPWPSKGTLQTLNSPPRARKAAVGACPEQLICVREQHF